MWQIRGTLFHCIGAQQIQDTICKSLTVLLIAADVMAIYRQYVVKALINSYC